MPTIRERKWTSLRQRLLNIAHEEHVDFQSVLTRYGLERFLCRLGRSEHRDALLLRGAFLLHAWQKDAAQPTWDIDFLGRGPLDIDRFQAMVADIATCRVDDDGMEFNPALIRVKTTRQVSLQKEIRIKVIGNIGRTVIPLRIAVGFGDTIGSEATSLTYPTLLGHEKPNVLAYQPQFIIAEKFERMAANGATNTRLRDYYDVWKISRTMDIPRPELVSSVRATFSKRGTAIPSDVPVGLSDDFARDDKQQRQWDELVDRAGLELGQGSLESIVGDLRVYLMSIANDLH